MPGGNDDLLLHLPECAALLVILPETHQKPEQIQHRRQHTAVQHGFRRQVVQRKYQHKNAAACQKYPDTAQMPAEIIPENFHAVLLFHQIPHAHFGTDKVVQPCLVQLFPQPVHVDSQGVLVHKTVRCPEPFH